MGQLDIESIQAYYKYCHTPTLRCDNRLRIVWSNDEAAKKLKVKAQPELNAYFPCLDTEYVLEHLADAGGFEVELTEEKTFVQLSFHPVLDGGTALCCFVMVRRHKQPEDMTVHTMKEMSKNQYALDLFTVQNRFALTSIFNTLPILKSSLERYELYDEIEYLYRIAGHSYSILKLILNCTEFNRLLNENSYFHPRKVDLRLPLGNLLAGVKLLLLHTDIDFSYEISMEPLVTEADSERINFALLQLISNACRFTSPGNRVVVTVGRQKQTITVRVSDKGVGIPAENLQKIFTPFFSFDPNTNSYAGIGLGLPYAQKVVRLHGGECIVSSSLNHGTTVSMSLPIKNTSGVPQLKSDPFEYVLGRFSPISILLSDVCTIPID